MKKVNWSDYPKGSWTKATTARGKVTLHIYPHGLKKAHPAHPFKIDVNDKCVGYGTQLAASKEFAESFIDWRPVALTRERYEEEFQRYAVASGRTLTQEVLDKGWLYTQGWSLERFVGIIDQACGFYAEGLIRKVQA